MQILSQDLSRQLEQGNSIKLEFGCGEKKRQGFYGIDHLPLKGVDVLADLNKPLSLLPDNCCEYVYSCHVLEHVQKLLPLMEEIHRISRAGGTIEIVVPHFSNVFGYSDPTHVRLFGLYSMHYFVASEDQKKGRKVPSFYTRAKFTIESTRLEFYRMGIVDAVLAPVASRLVNLNLRTQSLYERRLANLYHAWQIRFILKPRK